MESRKTRLQSWSTATENSVYFTWPDSNVSAVRTVIQVWNLIRYDIWSILCDNHLFEFAGKVSSLRSDDDDWINQVDRSAKNIEFLQKKNRIFACSKIWPDSIQFNKTFDYDFSLFARLLLLSDLHRSGVVVVIMIHQQTRMIFYDDDWGGKSIVDRKEMIILWLHLVNWSFTQQKWAKLNWKNRLSFQSE